ncbi:MAG TPA: sulfotransferase, partial [Solirubrobacteraceae bacterium]|nr:sulfotransferase [Solirubrobacteraceae bacterium]
MSASESSDMGFATTSPEGVVVLGMHRSGTSLVTRLINLLGLEVCRHDDLLVGRARNPRGHWESKSLLVYNERLLSELGRKWFCPPLLGPQEVSRLVRAHGQAALATLQRAHPDRPWVWKDPRTCALLPFWAAVLGPRAAYVLVVRHPFEVSDSLDRRNGCKPPLSLALWERYTRQAMLGAAGRPMLVCTYDAVLADPAAWCAQLSEFLGELGLRTRPVDGLAVDAFVMDELRHTSQSWTDLYAGPQLSSEQVALARAASSFTMQLRYQPPQLPDETPRSTAIFEEIAAMNPPAHSLGALPARLATPRARRAANSEDSAQPLSIVVAGPAASTKAAIAVLGDALPDGSELLGGAVDRARDQAAALARGAKAASGRIVVLSSGELTSCDPWYAAFKQALAEPLVGGIGPVIRFQSYPQVSHFGRAF